METLKSQTLYRMVWRWHFYAGVFVIPFVLLLSLTGAIYLFKPQLDNLHYAKYRNLPIDANAQNASAQIQAALTALPNSQFFVYELPQTDNEAVQILLTKNNNKFRNKKFRVFVNPNTLAILGIDEESKRLTNIAHDLHGELLMGNVGAFLVELAACWAIVLILSGLYLAWPRGKYFFAGFIYPRWQLKGRAFWRDIHAVIGLWISLLVLFLLISGLPWTLVWGNAFKEIRSWSATSAIKQDWKNSSAAEHNHHQKNEISSNNLDLVNSIIAQAKELQFTYPVLVMPPNAMNANWQVKSNAQNRPLRADAVFSAKTGELISIQRFNQRAIVDQVVGFGVAAHEGQLFGWLNQLLGLLTAITLILICISGFILWRKRAPEKTLGAPPKMANAKITYFLLISVVLLSLLLPLLLMSLLCILLLEFFIFRRSIKIKKWLGLD